MRSMWGLSRYRRTAERRGVRGDAARRRVRIGNCVCAYVSSSMSKDTGKDYLASVSILKSRCPLIDTDIDRSSLSARRGTTGGNPAIASFSAFVLSSCSYTHCNFCVHPPTQRLTWSFRASSPILKASALAYAHPGNTLGSILPSTLPDPPRRLSANQSYKSNNHSCIPAFSASRSRCNNAPCGSAHGSREYSSFANSNAVRTQPRRWRSLKDG